MRFPRIKAFFKKLAAIITKAADAANSLDGMHAFNAIDQRAFTRSFPTKFAIVFFAPPESGSLILMPIGQHNYNGPTHPRKSDAAKRRAMTETPTNAIAFKAYAVKNDGTIIGASPMHYFDGIPMSIQTADDGHSDIALIKNHLPETRDVVLVNNRYYPLKVILDEHGEPKRGAPRTPVIENDVAP